MLEQQQEKLVNAIRELYNRLERNESWPGSPLEKTPKGFPLTHDILERLGMLRLGPDEFDEPFEEDPDVLRRKMVVKPEENAYPTPQTIHSDFSPATSEVMDIFPSPFGNEMTIPMDPMDHFHPGPISRTPEEQYMGSANQFGWPQSGISYSETGNMYPACNVPPGYNGLGITREASNPCLPTPTYNDDLGYTGFNEVLTRP